MVTFFDNPKEHWVHLRTTNIFESPFSAIRLRFDCEPMRPDVIDDSRTRRGCGQRSARTNCGYLWNRKGDPWTATGPAAADPEHTIAAIAGFYESVV
jgi:hypothetical protein